MNILGLGDELIAKLYQHELLTNFPDFFTLFKRKVEFLQLERTGQKMFENIVASVERSKQLPADRLLIALGIEQVGAQAAKALLTKFGSIDEIIKADEDSLIQIKDIGPIAARSIVNYFSQSKNRFDYEKLKKLGLQTQVVSRSMLVINSPFANKTFAISGSFKTFSRDQLIDILQNEHGAKFTTGPTKNTDFMLIGEEAGSKLSKAEALGLRIVEENELLQLLGNK
ncbi:unnamed protein product [Didymodactylos carnosus]|uniref:BRCT domain-containing protein n=1 Tax=Didymodactylos carnosus TaxID=1234261 RepID=A0A8S2CXC8_9BILA|nr:unnamed protein product [Didymodactylos carnosus]CAF3540376.1 unnamed protein product [Didymodactylos carnosus]